MVNKSGAEKIMYQTLNFLKIYQEQLRLPLQRVKIHGRSYQKLGEWQVQVGKEGKIVWKRAEIN